MADGGITPTEGGIGGVLLLALGYGTRWVEAWIKSRRTPEQKAGDAAELDRQSVETASGLMAGMRADLDALRKVVADHGEQVTTLTASHHDCEQRCTALTGEVRKLQARNRTVEKLLAELKSPEATNPGGSVEGAIFELSDGGVTDVSGRPTIDKPPLERDAP